MKILHLADLHLGKILQEQSFLEDQKYMLNKIIEKIKEENIETILISGDIYDRSIPPTEAVDLLDEFLNVLIRELKRKVFIIAGNHDSKERLGFGNKIFEEEGLYISSKYDGKIKKVELEDEYGKLNIYMLPFVKPVEVKQYFDDEQFGYDEMIHKIIEKEEINTNERNIILTHQFVTARGEEVERTDSEVLSLGGTDNVDVSNYDKFDYVAIGHVHRPQRIGRDTARYAGTMLKYSFSEVKHKKTMPILEFKEKGNIDIKLEELVPLRDMREIKDTIEELLKKENYEGTNTDDYIRAIITNEEPLYDAIGQIRSIYPNVLKLEMQNSKTTLEIQQENLKEVKNKSEIELFNEFYKFQNNVELNDEINNLINKLELNINLKKEQLKTKYLYKMNNKDLNYLLQFNELNNELNKNEQIINKQEINLNLIKLEKEKIINNLEDLINFEEELESLKQEYEDLINKNNIINKAREFLQIAYEKMKNNVTPKFTANLSSNIEKISNGKYNKVSVNDEKGMIVEIPSGEYVSAEKLSAGTIEQLYLSLRLSMVKEISEETMPIILDEAFAYYDDERLENTLKFIAQTFNKNQILLFTCSHREEEILNRIDKEYQLIKLNS